MATALHVYITSALSAIYYISHRYTVQSIALSTWLSTIATPHLGYCTSVQAARSTDPDSRGIDAREIIIPFAPSAVSLQSR